MGTCFALLTATLQSNGNVSSFKILMVINHAAMACWCIGTSKHQLPPIDFGTAARMALMACCTGWDISHAEGTFVRPYM